MSNKSSEFMKLVEYHEREWGTKSYVGRPKLGEILSSPVVVFWADESKADKYFITLHADLQDIERHLLRLVFRTSIQVPKRRIVRIFEHQKRIIVKRVRLTFDQAPDS